MINFSAGYWGDWPVTIVYIYQRGSEFYWEAKPGNPCTLPFKDRVAAYEHAKYSFRGKPFVVCAGHPLRPVSTKVRASYGREMQPA